VYASIEFPGVAKIGQEIPNGTISEVLISDDSPYRKKKKQT